MIGDGAKPALVIVSKESYTDPDALPTADEVREVVVEAINETWGDARNMLLDVRKGEVQIQHEVAPTEPYDAIGIVVVFDQLPFNDYNEAGRWKFSKTESPWLDVMSHLHTAYHDEIEVWIDAVA